MGYWTLLCAHMVCIIVIIINKTEITPFPGISAWQCGNIVKSTGFEHFLPSRGTLTELLKSPRITQPESDQAVI